MKFFTLSIVVFITTVTFVAFRMEDSRVAYPKPEDFPITQCGTTFNEAIDFEAPVSLISGLGDLHYLITTHDSLAQKFFDQGLRFNYGFNDIESFRSFKEAARIDPSCAMALWGQALSLGPNINDPNPRKREAMAFEAIAKAKELSVGATQKEKDFILAMSLRYDGKPHKDRNALNVAYRNAMEALAKKYPTDAEALVLYADAIMTSMPWDYWNKDGSPKQLTPAAKTALELAIKKYPHHPGAHHLYIHLVEASKTPADARNSAEFLETAMPSAGHIVHMPSHIYIRVGEYERSNNVNILAVKADEEYLSKTSNQGMYRLGYYPHNIDFLSFGALMTGRSAMAVAEGNKLAFHMKSMEKKMPVSYDFFTAVPIISLVRFGKWNDILALPQPDDRNYHYSGTLHYARGLAFLRRSDLEGARKEFSKLDSIQKLDTLKSISAFFSSAQQILKVGRDMLEGELLIKEGKVDEGLLSLRSAVTDEEDIQYNEPPDWRIPARHFLGAALFETGRYDEAQKVYEQDLENNPENGWSLRGLANCQQKTGKTADASRTVKRLEKAWNKADITITSSRF